VVFSLHNEMVYSVAALQAGADGFVVKTEPPERLLAEVRRLLPAARAAE
jgi:DNA-binding NarL/FixJ family response regulator